MPEEQKFNSQDLPSEISKEAAREKLIRLGSLVNIHRWWARRPSVLSRVAVYLALAEQQALDSEFLAALSKISPDSTILSSARSHLRDAQWRWAWRESQHNQDESISELEEPQTPEAPKVLDPFAGGGSIPFEAARLSCQAYAGEFNPVAYHILRATLEFPSAYFLPESTIPGTKLNRTWAGLVHELRHWAERMESIASEKVSALFPTLQDSGELAPSKYLWFYFAQCLNPACQKIFPLQRFLRLNHTRAVQFTVLDGVLTPQIDEIDKIPEESNGRQVTCCFCDFQLSPNELYLDKSFHLSPVLAAVIERKERKRVMAAISSDEATQFVPWSNENDARLNELLSQDFASLLHSPLPTQTYTPVKRWGSLKFCDLFSPRQLLVALEYASAILEVHSEMQATQIPKERSNAIITYLAFFLGYLVDCNSKLCMWHWSRADAGSSFDRQLVDFPRVFVERSPNGLVEKWLSRILPAIETCASSPSVCEVCLGSASKLPYKDDFFDAIVTDPPFYDNIQYTELADFYWVWESSIIRDITPPQPESNVENPLKFQRGDNHDVYRQRLLATWREAYRVIKPGRMFCMLLSSKSKDNFEEYLTLTQQAGFELFDIKRSPERRGQPQNYVTASLLIYFRKPFTKSLRKRLKVEASEASNLLETAAAGKPVLYARLAQLFLDELEEEDILDLIPSVPEETRIEVLMKFIADHPNPQNLIEKCFGIQGVRRIVKQLNLSNEIESRQNLIGTILTYFGFSVPSPAGEEGIRQVQDKLRRMKSRIQSARDKTDIRGSFLDACTAVERLIRLSVWGWAQLIFQDERDRELIKILNKRVNNKKEQLNKLAFGDIAALFRELPDAIAQSYKAEIVKQKLGRQHIYLSQNKKTKFYERLNKFVSFRNKVEHDTEGYCSNSSEAIFINDIANQIEDIIKLLSELEETQAIPRVAEAIQEIIDKFGRRTYKLVLDNNTEIEVCFSSPIFLGVGYLYFGSGNNLRPVDPFILPLEELAMIP